MNFLSLAAILVAVELGLFLIVTLQRRSFPWLVTRQDELPELDPRALQKFIDYSFDPDLGWVRRPNSSGTENGRKGTITFNIDSAGSRSSNADGHSSFIAAFGDSYVFCRQVEDNETWEAQLSQQEGFGVLNFGVGNYGLDQALLRYEGMSLPSTVKVVVMGFVPETICRIQSYWKHYLEFGNTFAFKPRFMLGPSGELILVENLVKGLEDFASLKEKLPKIHKIDGFYHKKFRPLQFRFPYILSLLRHPLRQGMLIFALGFRGLLRSLGISKPWVENLPFTLVMKENIRDAHRMYEDRKSTELLSAILLRFKEAAYSRGHIPLVLVIPQLLDLRVAKNKNAQYQNYFRELVQSLPVLDLTQKFINSEFERLYVNDQYGGHLSVDGNRLVAKEISTWLKNLNMNY